MLIHPQEFVDDANFILNFYPLDFKENTIVDKNIPFMHQIKSDVECLQNLLKKISKNTVEIEKKIKIAVVGSFSCGKSSFINSILEDTVAPVEINPLTHGITRFVYGETEMYFADNKPIKKKEYQRKIQEENCNTRYFSISYPCDKLKEIELIDSPGKSSVSGEKDKIELSKSDDSLCEEAVDTADVVFFLQDIRNGSMEGSNLEWLNKIRIKNKDKPIYIILTWVDKRSKEERGQILKKIKEETKNLDINGFFLYASVIDEKIKSKRKETLLGYNNNMLLFLRNMSKNKVQLNSLIDEITMQNLSMRLFKILNFYKYKKTKFSSLKSDLESKIRNIVKDTLQYIQEIYSKKFEELDSCFNLERPFFWLVFNDKLYFRPTNNLVTLSRGEIFVIRKKLLEYAQKNGLQNQFEYLLDGEYTSQLIFLTKSFGSVIKESFDNLISLIKKTFEIHDYDYLDFYQMYQFRDKVEKEDKKYLSSNGIYKYLNIFDGLRTNLIFSITNASSYWSESYISDSFKDEKKKIIREILEKKCAACCLEIEEYLVEMLMGCIVFPFCKINECFCSRIERLMEKYGDLISYLKKSEEEFSFVINIDNIEKFENELKNEEDTNERS